MDLDQCSAMSEVRLLVDRYRQRCLWYLRPDYYPETADDALRTLRAIEAHGDAEAFPRAAALNVLAGAARVSYDVDLFHDSVASWRGRSEVFADFGPPITLLDVGSARRSPQQAVSPRVPDQEGLPRRRMNAIQAYDGERLRPILLCEWARMSPLPLLRRRNAPLIRRAGRVWATGQREAHHEHHASEHLNGLLRTLTCAHPGAKARWRIPHVPPANQVSDR